MADPWFGLSDEKVNIKMAVNQCSPAINIKFFLEIYMNPLFPQVECYSKIPRRC